MALSGLKKVAAGAAVALAAMGAVALTSSTADAASNGQQIQLVSKAHGVKAVNAEIIGHNQWGKRADAWIKVHPGDTKLANWWWKGDVTVKLHTASGRVVTLHHWVPAYQRHSNWSTVRYEATGDMWVGVLGTPTFFSGDMFVARSWIRSHKHLTAGMSVP